MQNVRRRQLKPDRYRGGVLYGLSVSCRGSDLSVWISSTSTVLCTWSDPRKRSETLVSMNRLTPPHPATPPATSGGVLVGLAVLSLSGLIGLTCSLYMILSTQEGQTSALKQRLEVPSFSTSIFCSQCIYRNLPCSPADVQLRPANQSSALARPPQPALYQQLFECQVV